MARGSSRKDKNLQRALDRIRKLPNITTFEDAHARRAFSSGSVPPPRDGELPPRESFADGARALFAEHVERTKTTLLLDLYDVNVKTRGLARTVVFQVNANCHSDLAQTVGSHPVVRTPLKAFLGEMRARYPGVTMKIALAFDPFETGRAADVSLKRALKLAGATDLIKTLRL